MWRARNKLLHPGFSVEVHNAVATRVHNHIVFEVLHILCDVALQTEGVVARQLRARKALALGCHRVVATSGETLKVDTPASFHTLTLHVCNTFAST